MTDQQTQTQASPSDQPALRDQGAQAAADASRQQASDQQRQAAEPTRPDYLPETFWDADKKAAKTDDLKGAFERIKADDDRRASLPKTADGYQVGFAKDFQLPENWEINQNDPMWAAGREYAHKQGLTQDQFADLATMYVKNQIAGQNAVKQAIEQRDASLGANGGARVEALNTWFKGMFGDKVGSQFSSALFTKDIIEGFETMQRALTDQGVTSFNGTGREEGRRDGKPANWDQMSPVDRRTHQLMEQQRAAGGR